MKSILITGIPGTGKTTIANYLAENHDFEHIDLETAETESEESLLHCIKLFVSGLESRTQPAVLSWGFPYEYTSLVLYLKSKGVKVVWFDGDREAALRAFSTRGSVPEEAFHEQVGNLGAFKVLEVVNPLVYNTFEESGEFKTLHQIAVDLIEFTK